MSKKTNAARMSLHADPGYRKYFNSGILLALILLLAIALRFYNLGTESYYIDEMFTVIEGQQSVSQLLASGRLDQPPGYYLPFRLWIQLFGISEVGTRSFSALAGVGSIVVIYIIGRELFGKSVGLLSSLLMAVSEFQIHYSQSNRFYSFFEFLVLLSFLFFVLTLRGKKVIHFVLYVLTSIFMVYAHTYGLFIIVAQNLLFFIQGSKTWREIIAWLISQVVIGLTLLPYLGLLLLDAGGLGGAVELNLAGSPVPSVLDPIHFLFGYLLGHRHGRSWVSVIINFSAAGVFLVIGTWAYAVWLGRDGFPNTLKSWAVSLRGMVGPRNEFTLLACWLLCPLVIPLIVSLAINRPMYEEHYTISAAPAFYLLLAFGLFNIRKIIPLVVTLGTLTILVAPGLVNYYRTPINEQWRNVAAYIEDNSEGHEAIVFAPNWRMGIQQRSFEYYYKGDLQGCGLPDGVIDPGAIFEDLMQCVSGHERFWVIIADYPTVASDDRFRSFFLDSNEESFHKLRDRQFVGISVYLFEFIK